MPKLSIIELLEKFLANNFALSDSEDNTSEPLNRRSIGDLPLLRTLLTIREKSRGPRLWEVIDFMFICKFFTFKKTFETITI